MPSQVRMPCLGQLGKHHLLLGWPWPCPGGPMSVAGGRLPRLHPGACCSREQRASYSGHCRLAAPIYRGCGGMEGTFRESSWADMFPRMNSEVPKKFCSEAAQQKHTWAFKTDPCANHILNWVPQDLQVWAKASVCVCNTPGNSLSLRTMEQGASELNPPCRLSCEPHFFSARDPSGKRGRSGSRCFDAVRAQGGCDFPKAAVTKRHRLRTADLFALTAVGARSPKSKWQLCPLKVPGASFQACCSLRPVMAQPQPLPPASCRHCLCVWASVSSSQWDSSQWSQWPEWIQDEFILRYFTKCVCTDAVHRAGPILSY